ncbi:hypothetical protein QFC21_004985 [Naganishia friedmannii]|uniref:Uncharacterized protein n=1 Tax=Naganishia friedmannii TaxID=89922 RepID=A0ACC2VBG7_9TREE|nr:hypothetical protein QFC21_004985 [Naganishia friedmannii]
MEIPPVPSHPSAQSVAQEAEKEETTGLSLSIPPAPVAATEEDPTTPIASHSIPEPDYQALHREEAGSVPTGAHELGRRDDDIVGPAEKASGEASHPGTTFEERPAEEVHADDVKVATAEESDGDDDNDDLDNNNAAQTRSRLAEAARIENEQRQAEAAAATAAEQAKNAEAQSSPLFAGTGFPSSTPASAAHSRTGSTQFASMASGVRMTNGRTLLGSANGLPAGLIYSDESDSEEDSEADDGDFDPRAAAARKVSGATAGSMTKSPKMSERDRRVFGDDLDDGGLLERVKGVATGATAALGLGAGGLGLGAASLGSGFMQRSPPKQPETSQTFRQATPPPAPVMPASQENTTTTIPATVPATPAVPSTMPPTPVEPLRVRGSQSGASSSRPETPPQSTVQENPPSTGSSDDAQRRVKELTPPAENTSPVALPAPASVASPPQTVLTPAEPATNSPRQVVKPANNAMSLSPPMLAEESPMGTPTPAGYGATSPLAALAPENGFQGVAQGMDEVDAGYAFPPIPVATSAPRDEKQLETSSVPPVAVISPAPVGFAQNLATPLTGAHGMPRTPSPHAASNGSPFQYASPAKGVTTSTPPPARQSGPTSYASAGQNLQADNSVPTNGWASVPGDPMVWTVEQVVGWAKGKGFDDSVCDKLIEHDITGDVLLEMDVHTLKEIDIVQFGKRVKIANAINELRRPGSMRSVGNGSTRSQQFSPGYSSHHRVPSIGAVGYPQAGVPASPGYDNVPPQTQQHSRAASMSGVVDTIPENGTYQPAYQPPQRQIDTAALGFSHSSTSSPGATQTDYADWNTSRKSSVAASQHESRSHAPVIHEEDESSHPAVVNALTPEPPLSANMGSALSQPTTVVGSSMDRSTSVHSKASSIPPTPTTPSIRRDSVEARPSSAFGHRKARSSMDANSTTGRATSDRVSNLLSGALSRNRKPAPRFPSSASQQNLDQVANDGDRRSISKFMGGQSKKDSKGSTPSSINKASTANPQRISVGTPIPTSPNNRTGSLATNDEASTALSKIGTPDFSGFLKKKGDRYNTWKTRYFVLKGPRLYYLRNEKEQKLKGHIDLAGYKVMTDANTSSGNYGFQLVHDGQKTHHFSSSDHRAIKEWMKNLMKATITRDFTAPVISSCNIHTIPLREAQAMAPRPPSPTSMQATQRAARRDNPNQLTARDASVLMEFDKEKGKHMSIAPTMDSKTAVSGLGYGAPPRPSREMRRPSTMDKARSGSLASFYPEEEAPVTMASPIPVPPIPSQFLNAAPVANKTQPELKSTINSGNSRQAELIYWINANLPSTTEKATSIPGSFVSGKLICRVIENIAGPNAATAGQVVTDAMFESIAGEPNLEGIFSAFDKCIDENVDINGVSINDIRTGDAERITQLLENLRSWGEQRKTQT